MTAMRDHTKLRAFELADEVAVLVYRATRKFPKDEVYGLSLSARLGYLVADAKPLAAKIVETEKVLAALIRSLRSP
jgi:hypothetical protein